MTTKKSSEPTRSSESSELRHTKSAPQLSESKMAPLVLSGVGIRSTESPSNTATPSNAIPPQKRNIDGLRYEMSPSRPNDEEQMVQILTALRKIHFPKTDS